MNKQILVILFSLLFIKFYAQDNLNENIHFLKVKIYHTELKKGIPFSEICIVDGNDSVVDGITADFDGYANFHINPNELNVDSFFFRIRIYKGHILQGNKIKEINDFGKPILIPLNQIKLMKDFCFEDNLRFAVAEYKILSKKELMKYKKKEIMPMPERKQKNTM